MTSGKPFSANEIAFVKAHLHEKYPSVIARALGQYFPDDNGGSRGTKAVSMLMQKLREPEPVENKTPRQKQKEVIPQL